MSDKDDKYNKWFKRAGLRETLVKQAKEFTYESYSRLIEDGEDYERVTRNKMADAIIEFYKVPENILAVCNTTEIEFLKKTLEGKKIDLKREENARARKLLLRKCLLFEPELMRVETIIPEELVGSLREALKKYDVQAQSKRDAIVDIVIGAVRLYGAIEDDKLYDVISRYIKIDQQCFRDLITTDKYLHFFIYPTMRGRISYLLHYDYYDIEKELLDAIQARRDWELAKRPLEDVITSRYGRFIGEAGLILENIIEKLGHKIWLPFDFERETLYAVVLANNAKNIAEWVEDTLERFEIKGKEKKEAEEFLSLLEEIMGDMPSAVLRGRSMREFEKDVLRPQTTKVQGRIDKLKKKDEIKEYMAAREELMDAVGYCMSYLATEGIPPKFEKAVSKLDLKNDENILMNLLLFHSMGNEKTIFEQYREDKFPSSFDRHKKIDFSPVKESLFIIKKSFPSKGTLIMRDSIDGEEYEVYDVAMSSQGLLDGRLFFTSLVRVNRFTFTCEYGFPFGKAKNGEAKKRLLEIQELADEMSYIKNKETRRFLAAYLVNKESGENFLKLAL